MSAVSDGVLDSALSRLKPACKVKCGPVSEDLDARLHRLFCLSYDLNDQRYTVSGPQTKRSELLDALDAKIDAVYDIACALRQLDADESIEFDSLSRVQISRIVATCGEALAAPDDATAVDLIMLSGEAESYLEELAFGWMWWANAAKSRGLCGKPLEHVESVKPETSRQLSALVTSRRDRSWTIFDVGYRLRDPTLFEPMSPVTFAEAESIRAKFEAAVADVLVPPEGSKTKSKRKMVKLVTSLNLAGGHSQGKDGYDVDLVAVLPYKFPESVAAFANNKAGLPEQLMLIFEGVDGVISRQEDPVRTKIRSPSDPRLKPDRREMNFAGLVTLRLACRLSPTRMVSVDVALAFSDSAGATSLCWSASPSCLNALQKAAHARDYHLLPCGLFERGRELVRSGLVATTTEQDVYNALRLPYIAPEHRRTDTSRQLHLSTNGIYLAQDAFRPGGWLFAPAETNRPQLPSAPDLVKTRVQLDLDAASDELARRVAALVPPSASATADPPPADVESNDSGAAAGSDSGAAAGAVPPQSALPAPARVGKHPRASAAAKSPPPKRTKIAPPSSSASPATRKRKAPPPSSAAAPTSKRRAAAQTPPERGDASSAPRRSARKRAPSAASARDYVLGDESDHSDESCSDLTSIASRTPVAITTPSVPARPLSVAPSSSTSAAPAAPPGQVVLAARTRHDLIPTVATVPVAPGLSHAPTRIAPSGSVGSAGPSSSTIPGARLADDPSIQSQLGSGHVAGTTTRRKALGAIDRSDSVEVLQQALVCYGSSPGSHTLLRLEISALPTCSANLSFADALTSRPSEWSTSAAVYYTALSLLYSRDASGQLSVPIGAIWCDFTDVASFALAGSASDLSEILPNFHLLFNKRILVFFDNPTRSHWINSVVVNPGALLDRNPTPTSQACLYTLDSAYDFQQQRIASKDTMHRCLVKKTIKFLENARTVAFPGINWAPISGTMNICSPTLGPQQRDGFNCGIFSAIVPSAFASDPDAAGRTLVQGRAANPAEFDRIWNCHDPSALRREVLAEAAAAASERFLKP